MHLMIPSSSPFGKGLYKDSIISNFGDWLRTTALYLDINGQYKDPTTWKNSDNKAEQISCNAIDKRKEKIFWEEDQPQQLMEYLIDQEIHERHPCPESLLEFPEYAADKMHVP